MSAAPDRLTRLAWSALGVNLGVILWGAYVRASGSGAGCGSHWPLCNGEVLPRAAAAATWIEFTHRVSSGLALLLVLALVALAWRWRERSDPARAAALCAGFFMLTEAGVGAGLVLFQLVAGNASLARALFMAVHLINTFFLLAALTLTAHFAGRRRAEVMPAGGRGLGRGLIALALFGLLLVGVSGAVAALGDTLAASLPAAMTRDTSSTAYALIRLRVLHPFISLAVGLGVSLLTLRLVLPAAPPHPARRAATWVLALTLGQLACGALNVWLKAPVWMQLVHLLLADLVWIAFVLMAAVTFGLRARDTLPPPAWLAVAQGPPTPPH